MPQVEQEEGERGAEDYLTQRLQQTGGSHVYVDNSRPLNAQVYQCQLRAQALLQEQIVKYKGMQTPAWCADTSAL